MKLQKIIYLAVAASLTLSGCNGSGNVSSTGSAQMTGILSDSYVKGVSYSTSSGKSGSTGANGEFSYSSGNTVTFKIGKVSLGSVKMDSSAIGTEGTNKLVRPKDLAGVVDETDDKALAIAQVIQTAAGAAPSDTHIDVSLNSAKLSTPGTIDSLDKASTVLAGAGLTPVSLANVTQHLLNAPTQVKSVTFTPTDITGLSDANRAVAYTTSEAQVTYSDGTTKNFPLSFVNLFNNTDTGKTADGSAAAAIRNKAGTILTDASGNPYIPQTPDANSVINVNGTPYLVTHFEYENNDTVTPTPGNWYGKLPMTMTLAKLNQSDADGALSVASVRQIDFSTVNGLWIPCAGSRSPWNTHLGSEEYEPDARCEVDAAYAATAGGSCLGMEYTARMDAFRNAYGEATVSPYQYGRVPEVTISANGSTTVEKWYTLGRIAREKVQMFGDSRTAIQGDDGTYTALTMFVADKPGDLSAGTLYAARWNQVSADGTNGGKATLAWISLGHATHAEIKAAVDAGITFNDLFTTSATTAAGFKQVKAGHEIGNVEYLQLKAGTFPAVGGASIATLAAFLETRRYAAYLGATTEFEKYEGVAYNARDNKAYAAMTRMTKGMENLAADPANDIRLMKNSSGAVYELILKPNQIDSTGTPINSDFVPVVMQALVTGTDIVADADGNRSDLNGIASPDNVWFSERMRVLFIGEDSGNHVNNYLWAYHVDTGSLVRILSLPMGAESTGLQVLENLNGHAYIMSNYQHAADRNNTNLTVYNRILPLIDPQKAEVGYLGGLPAMY
ncbi:MAG: alkaline phosphatase PhoX [Gallionella sp.]